MLLGSLTGNAQKNKFTETEKREVIDRPCRDIETKRVIANGHVFKHIS